MRTYRDAAEQVYRDAITDGEPRRPASSSPIGSKSAAATTRPRRYGGRSRAAASRTRPSSDATAGSSNAPWCWLLRFKRLGLRYDRTERTLRPLLLLAVSIINLRRLVSITES